MAFKSQVKASAICNLCKRNQKEQYHEILSGTVTKNLFNRFQILLTAIYSENVNEREMILGLKIDTIEDKYQKAFTIGSFLTFTIRCIIHSNKWTDFSDMNMKQITDRLAKMIVHEFKSQVKNRYDLRVQIDDLAHFKKQYLLNGTVGQLRNHKVKWSD